MYLPRPAPTRARPVGAGCDTLPGTVLQMNATTTSPTVTIDAAVTNGSHEATAKAAPAAAAATAVNAVWLVANMPWMRPTSEGADPSVSRDWTAGMAAAKPSASDAPSRTRAGTLLMNGYEAHRTVEVPMPTNTSLRRSM